MQWRAFPRSVEGLPPKLGNLAIAARAGIETPPTVWTHASEARGLDRPAAFEHGPLIVRSASPTEDTEESSQAGQFHSEVVPADADADAFRAVVARVVESLPSVSGRATGCVFVQPLRVPERGGIVFFDGFYFERTTALGGNAELTSGRARGDVSRGHVERGDPWTDWLLQVYRAFVASHPSPTAIDIEFTDDGGRYELLQVRPATFPLRRDHTLSLANHREILGATPSPWIVSAVVEAGRETTEFFAESDPSIRSWLEPYAVEFGGQAWMNFSFFFRLMDHWGLPRTWVTEGVGGESAGPADERVLWPRFVRSIGALCRLQWRNWTTVHAAPRALAELRERVEAAHTLPELFDANVHAMALALRTNFALGGMLSGAARVRSALRIRGRPRVVTAEMMRHYDALRGRADAERGLDAWLTRFGHRGPLESDPRQPRFREMREELLSDLARPSEVPMGSEPGSDSVAFALERRREWFRNELMRAWEPLRARMLWAGETLVASGVLERVQDVFELRGEDLRRPMQEWNERAATNRVAAQDAHAIAYPLTASRSDLEEIANGTHGPASTDESVLRGIGLGGAAFEGVVRHAASVPDALGDARLDRRSVLVVTALEPSWAVLFGRVGAVVAEIGGELSHASILLREAHRPAVVNCAGAIRSLRDGEAVRVDPERGTVTRVDRTDREPGAAAPRDPGLADPGQSDPNHTGPNHTGPNQTDPNQTDIGSSFSRS